MKNLPTDTIKTHDLAETLRGEEGRFVATTPSGDVLIVDAQAGHSIASLRILPRAKGTSFYAAKVANLRMLDNSSSREGQNQRIQTVPVAV